MGLLLTGRTDLCDSLEAKQRQWVDEVECADHLPKGLSLLCIHINQEVEGRLLMEGGTTRVLPHLHTGGGAGDSHSVS